MFPCSRNARLAGRRGVSGPRGRVGENSRPALAQSNAPLGNSIAKQSGEGGGKNLSVGVRAREWRAVGKHPSRRVKCE